MGTCFSKKPSSSSSPSPSPPSALPAVVKVVPPHSHPFLKPQIDANEKPPRVEEMVKKEIFVIKQRKSHERRPEERPKLVLPQSPSSSAGVSDPTTIVDAIIAKTTPVRTSSCTKEEVDAILIQCGRLSRSSSDKVSSEGGARKYSGSKRSYDFDQEKGKVGNGDGEQVEEEGKYCRSSHRRTPSRERDGESKRSGSRHRSPSTSREEERKRNGQNGGSTSRRLSRSPGRRSETTSSSSAVAGSDKSRGPAKMVSVPASTTGAIKRVSVKRATASPRSQSPANVRENSHHQTPSLSRSSSRKDDSPYRRIPLTEIDDNCVKLEQHINKKPVGTNSKSQACKEADHQGEAPKKTFHFRSHSGSQKLEANVETETLKQPQTITRSRSSRRSRDLDFLTNNGDDTLVNVPTSYASILLEDIQNFHQKNSNSNNPSFTLPPCVTKACSILDAVADLNSSNASNATNAPTEERSTSTAASANSNINAKSSNVQSRKKTDPFVETEVFLYDDIMEPSIHKYITVRRGAAESGETEPQESSGSNSVVTRQHWLSSSSWEPNSADSTDRTSGSNIGDEVVVDKEEPSLMVHKRKVLSKG